jgi:hypothetical protein
VLVSAIVAELKVHPIFPPRHRDRLPDCGLYIQQQGDKYIFSDVDKPSVRDDYPFPTPEGAARAYIQKLFDSYWLKPDRDEYQP